MAPKKKKQGAQRLSSPLLNPNNQLPVCGSYASLVSESNLLCLVRMGVLPPQELSLWRVWKGITIPTENTYEFVVFNLFLIRAWFYLFPHSFEAFLIIILLI